MAKMTQANADFFNKGLVYPETKITGLRIDFGLIKLISTNNLHAVNKYTSGWGFYFSETKGGRIRVENSDGIFLFYSNNLLSAIIRIQENWES